MTRPTNVTALFASTFLVSVLLTAGAPHALAQVLTTDQQKCVNAMNKAAAKVAATQGKENSGCIKAGTTENLDNPTVDACLTADNKGKVASAQTKASEAQMKSCGAPPPYGYAGAVVINAATVNEEIALAQSIFGNPIQPGISVDSSHGKCQAAVIKAAEKLASTRMKAFNSCKKEQMKTGDITNQATLQNCMVLDWKGKVLAAATKLDETVVSKCADGLDYFPGCSSESGTAPALSGCVERKTMCATCLIANAVDALNLSCDAYDDGMVNQTCRQCGNGLAEAPEPCDTAGDSNSCDFDCTIPSCGDSHTNTLAGEACDTGAIDTAGCDDDCSLPSCGDGNLNTAAGEVCDDGDLNDDDGCDSNCTLTGCGNGIVTGVEECDDDNDVDTDACRNSCVDATCGDGVACTAGNCTSGPGAGPEVCDDGNGSDTDTCLTTCAAASCGDGFTCNSVGCTSGPSGGLEQCDDAGANSDGTPDACRTTCANPGCGDGVVDSGEGCDDDNLVNTDSCLNSCVAATCGDGFTCSGMGCTSGPGGGAEDCDDDNGSNTDSCLNDCDAASCGDGFLCNSVGCTSGPSGGLEQCDDAGANSDVTPDACRTSCADAFCGDNVSDTGEFCDTAGNTMSCDADCTGVAGGDGFINPANSETCDGMGETMTCDANCTAATCGDGTVNATAGENCEDGNAMSGDGCSSSCQTGPGSGEQDPECPNLGELTLYSKNSNIVCTTNADCTFPRFCNTAVSRCETVADLDSGWNGAGHDSDINDQVTAAATLLCEGPSESGCGECTVTGISPTSGNCRCANAITSACDEPLVADMDDCGGAICNCYFGAPFPLVSQGTPVCVSNKFSAEITGTANPDLGSGEIQASLRASVFLGYTTDMPCAVCGGKCSNDNSGCIFDEDCDMGATCNQDTPGDGARDGVCIRDASAHTGSGEPCEIDGLNASFPARLNDPTPGQGGAGYSIDCQPNSPNVAGQGLKITLQQTTGVASQSAGIDCDAGGVGTDLCPCSICNIDTSEPCDSNADCAASYKSCANATHDFGFECNVNSDCTSINLGPCQAGILRCRKNQAMVCATNADCSNKPGGNCNAQTCSGKGSSAPYPEPNFCLDDICTDEGGGEGTCSAGPNFLYCDGMVKADGVGINACLSNADCGGGLGNCAYVDEADCFLDPIVATGSADPDFPVAAAVFCIPPTSNNGVNNAAGLPGPGRVTSQGAARTFCASDNNVEYNAGGSPPCP
jgi:cysteine-rich repeat protein